MKERFDNLLKESPIIAILRGITPGEVIDVCNTLYNHGIRVMEIPLNSPTPFESIRIAAENFGDKMAIGAGTVLTVEDARKVKASGGTFCVSPNTDSEVIKEVKTLGMLSVPGFFTASEGFAALKAGADYLKLFPACLGTSYIKDLQAVIKAPIVAVGGVNGDNMPEFLKICPAVGIGSAIYKAGKPLDVLANDVKNLMQKIR